MLFEHLTVKNQVVWGTRNAVAPSAAAAWWWQRAHLPFPDLALSSPEVTAQHISGSAAQRRRICSSAEL